MMWAPRLGGEGGVLALEGGKLAVGCQSQSADSVPDPCMAQNFRPQRGPHFVGGWHGLALCGVRCALGRAGGRGGEASLYVDGDAAFEQDVKGEALVDVLALLEPAGRVRPRAGRCSC